MAGTREGGLKAAQTNRAHDPNFYREIGRIGGGERTHRGLRKRNGRLGRLNGLSASGYRRSERGKNIKKRESKEHLR